MLKILITTAMIILFINADESKTLYFGVTSVALKNDAKNIYDLTSFLSKKANLEISPKFAKNYDEMEQMLEKRDVDFAYVCGATYLEAKDSANLEVLALPYFENEPFYSSLVIARVEDSATTLLSFKDRIYAFSDPKSNSGSLVPKYELKQEGIDYQKFFADVVYTYDHSDSIQAVIDGYVDGASVDSLVYEGFKLHNPQEAKKVKVVQEFGGYQSTPVVIRKSIDSATKTKLLEAFRELADSKDGEKILNRFGVCRFDLPESIDYADVEKMMMELESR